MKATTPLVTIAIPTYNRAGSYLKWALESALAQTYPNLEILVSDNGSSDHTEELVKTYGDRVRYVRQEPALTPNGNADFCLLAASGAYFHLLHDDDLIDPDFIEACMEAFEGRDEAFVRTGARVMSQDGTVLKTRPNPVLGEDFFRFCQSILEGKAVTYFCNTLYRTEPLRAVGGFQSRRFAYQDVMTNIRLAHRHGWIDIEAPKAAYRLHDSKLGGAVGIRAWCDDSLQMLGLMRELLPSRAAYIQKEGTRLMCRRNIAKAAKTMNLPTALRAYAIILRKYRFRQFPARLLYAKIRNACFGSGGRYEAAK